MDDFKRSHIPAFGNWDYEDGLPITQYFESARQAGLLRYSYGEAGAGVGGGGDLYSCYSTSGYEENDLYLKPSIAVVPCSRSRKIKGCPESEYQWHGGKEQKKQARVHDMTLSPTPTSSRRRTSSAAPKAVDEDLYKVPPEFLYNTNPHNNKKRKRTFGFFSRCLMPLLCTTV